MRRWPCKHGSFDGGPAGLRSGLASGFTGPWAYGPGRGARVRAVNGASHCGQPGDLQLAMATVEPMARREIYEFIRLINLISFRIN